MTESTGLSVGPPEDPKDTGDVLGHPNIADPVPEEVTDPSDPSYVELDPETEPEG